MRKILFSLIKISVICGFTAGISCSSDTSQFYHANLSGGGDKLVIASNVAGQYALAMYSLDGTLLRVLAEYVPQNTAPRGLAALSPYEFLVAFDGTNIDTVERFSLYDGSRPFVNDSNLSGNIFQLRRHETHGVFVIETNVVESFDHNGIRVGNPRIPTTIGGCVQNVSRGATFNAAGQLVVVGNGNDDILVYDVSDPLLTTCVRGNGFFAGTVDPVAVMAHSNGRLYIATQGDDRIYELNGDGSGTPTVVFNNITFINNPTALVETADGNILVASDGTDTIIEITTAGQLVGGNYLIGDFFTNSISDMIILREEE